PQTNAKAFEVSSATRDTLILKGSVGGGNEPERLSHISNTGKLHCTWQTATSGCAFLRFPTAAGGFQTFPLTNCVTDRPVNPTGDQRFSTNLAGRNYAESGNKCISSPIVPLTSNKTTLKGAIASLTTDGSTAGHLGIAWAWHMLSPNLGYLWNGEGPPAAYDEPNLLKAAIIMTDGDFNTVHCNGVVSWSSTGGTSSGQNTDKIACNAPNG